MNDQLVRLVALAAATALSGCAAAPSLIGGLNSVTPLGSQAATPQPVAMQMAAIDQPTDASLTCAQLIAANQTMDQIVAANGWEVPPTQTTGGQVLADAASQTATNIATTTAMATVGRFIPFAGLITPLAAQSMTTPQQNNQVNVQIQQQQAALAVSAAQQRKMKLTQLASKRKCA